VHKLWELLSTRLQSVPFTAYCSLECQQTDSRTHQQLCSAFKKLSPPTFPSRPSPSHYLAIYFPVVSRPACKPQLQWVDTKEIASGFLNPVLDQLFHIPDHPGYHGRGLQIVRGNILRGRPKFLDSLNICYIDDYITDELHVNETAWRAQALSVRMVGARNSGVAQWLRI